MPFNTSTKMQTYQKEYRIKNKDKLKQKHIIWYSKNKKLVAQKKKEVDYTPEGRLHRLFLAAKARAKKFNLDFSVLESELSMPEVCPILGIKLNYGAGKGNDYNRASLDRIDNTKGYTKDNIQIISLRANVIKRDATLDELIKITNYMKKYVEEKGPV